MTNKTDMRLINFIIETTYSQNLTLTPQLRPRNNNLTNQYLNIYYIYKYTHFNVVRKIKHFSVQCCSKSGQATLTDRQYNLNAETDSFMSDIKPARQNKRGKLISTAPRDNSALK